jgi:UDP-N-acetylglucosamine diphosphorylase / glucose-1-phosphate thymidylyltransferase / UDP-N-acetylgalactosamine diphosphorylase / glucosamine-1-phosphate N-acetyltransferase / galactosamine-1-phosphate N-acetyltransferase
MASHICVFEDDLYSRLLPLVHFRPTYNLRCGILSLREKIQLAYPKAKIGLHCREYLSEYIKERYPKFSVNEISLEKVLFVNGRTIVDQKFAKSIPLKGEDVLYVNGNSVVAARVSGEKLKTIQHRMNGTISLSDFDGLKKEQFDVALIDYPWDLIKYNGDQIRSDFTLLKKLEQSKKIKNSSGVFLLNKKNVVIGKGTILKPGVVIDAEDGPVFIGKNVTVMPFSVIMGPAYIGDNSVVKAGAKIYHDTSVGPLCKVGGEIEASIIHSYSNKQHDGFLGHSYLSPWVNLGAGTTTSDLKNNYSNVRVDVNGESIDTRMQFVGLIMGDHSKTAINSTINTGTIVGISSNIFGSGFPPKYVPSFSWGGGEGKLTTYKVDKALEVARKVMLRRKIELSKPEENIFKTVFDLTDEERRKLFMS